MFVLPENKIAKELGETAGGIGSTLERLANRKIQHMENEYNRRAQLKEMFENQQIQQAQRQAARQGFEQRLIQNGYQPQFARVASEFMDNPKLLERMEFPGDMERQEAQSAAINKLIQQPGGNQEVGPSVSAPSMVGAPMAQGAQPMGQAAQPTAQPRLLGGKPKELVTPQMQLQAGIANAKMAQQERLHKEAAVEKSFEKAAPEVASALEKIQAADASLDELNTIKELNKTGQLFQGPERALLEKFKLEDVLTNAPTQIAQKAMSRLVIDVAKDFKTGGRLTNDMFKVIEKGTPNLLNRPEALEANAALTEAKIKLGKARAEEQVKVVRDYEEKGKKLPTAWKDIAEKNLATTAKKIAKETSDIVQRLVRKATGKSTPEDLHPASTAEEGDAFELNGKFYEVRNGRWEPVK